MQFLWSCPVWDIGEPTRKAQDGSLQTSAALTRRPQAESLRNYLGLRSRAQAKALWPCIGDGADWPNPSREPNCNKAEIKGLIARIPPLLHAALSTPTPKLPETLTHSADFAGGGAVLVDPKLGLDAVILLVQGAESRAGTRFTLFRCTFLGFEADKGTRCRQFTKSLVLS